MVLLQKSRDTRVAREKYGAAICQCFQRNEIETVCARRNNEDRPSAIDFLSQSGIGHQASVFDGQPQSLSQRKSIVGPTLPCWHPHIVGAGQQQTAKRKAWDKCGQL